MSVSYGFLFCIFFFFRIFFCFSVYFFFFLTHTARRLYKPVHRRASLDTLNSPSCQHVWWLPRSWPDVTLAGFQDVVLGTLQACPRLLVSLNPATRLPSFGLFYHTECLDLSVQFFYYLLSKIYILIYFESLKFYILGERQDLSISTS